MSSMPITSGGLTRRSKTSMAPPSRTAQTALGRQMHGHAQAVVLVLVARREGVGSAAREEAHEVVEPQLLDAARPRDRRRRRPRRSRRCRSPRSPAGRFRDRARAARSPRRSGCCRAPPHRPAGRRRRSPSRRPAARSRRRRRSRRTPGRHWAHRIRPADLDVVAGWPSIVSMPSRPICTSALLVPIRMSPFSSVWSRPPPESAG